MTPIEFNNRYERLHDLLFAFAMKLTKNIEDAKDLMQETVANGFANRHRFTMGTNFKAWMTTIMRNAFINDYRKKRTRNQVEQPIEDVAYAVSNKMASDKTDAPAMLQDLRFILDGLDDNHRLPFMMFYRGFQYNEIADHFDLPIGTVKSRIFFARKKLKSRIKAHYGTQHV